MKSIYIAFIFLTLSYLHSFSQASLSGRGWLDCNANGLRDTGESPFLLDEVFILNADSSFVVDIFGNPVTYATVNAEGIYQFLNLPAGSYIVQYVFSTERYATSQINAAGGIDDISDVGTDSDFTSNGELATSIVVQLDGSENFTTLDAGLIPIWSVGNFIWHDHNGNGLQDINENGIEGIEINLLNSDDTPAFDAYGNIINPLSSEADGKYSFQFITPGSYKLVISNLNDWIISPMNVDNNPLYDSDASPLGVVTVTIGCTHNGNPEIEDIDIGLFKKVKIGGTIWLDSDEDNRLTNADGELSNIEIWLQNKNGGNDQYTKTDQFGNYNFEVTPGLYDIVIQQSNFYEILLNRIGCTFDDPSNTANPNDENDNDDSAIFNPSINESIVKNVEIMSGLEPTQDGFENLTFDICFKDKMNLAASCETVNEIVCDLRTLEGQSFSMHNFLLPPFPSPLCPNESSSAHNMTWLGFVAGSGDYAIEIEPNNCLAGANGNLGIQAGLYTNCDFSEAIFCKSSCSIDRITIENELMTPGERYYLFFDGCAGSVCNLNFKITGNYIPHIFNTPVLSCKRQKCDTLNVSDLIDIKINNYSEGTFYWTIIKPDQSKATLISHDPIISYFLSTEGQYIFKLDSIFSTCGNNNTSTQLEVFARNASNDKLQGIVYYDKNENDIYDSGIDLPLKNANVIIESINKVYLTNPEGRFFANVSEGQYALKVSVPYGSWQVPILFDTLTIGTNISYIDFGFKKKPISNAAVMFVNSPLARCNVQNPVRITIHNSSLNLYGAKLVMKFDTRSEVSNFDKTTTTTGDKVIAEITDFLEGNLFYNLSYDIEYDDIHFGEIMTHFFWIIDENGDTLDHYELNQEVLCSFDPNDKSSLPDRAGPYNFTLRNESITYTIRFQNTGNDTAFYISVEDNLDLNLEIASLQVIESSHNMNTVIHGQKVSFIFEDIVLPDSFSNVEASQGFVSFVVNVKDSIPEFTQIHNKAFIYFDNNQAIITNNTTNTIVNSLYENLNEDFGSIRICENLISSYRGPTSFNDEGIIEDPNGDGKKGWQGNPTGFKEGLNIDSIYVGNGIFYTQKFFLIIKKNTEGQNAHFDLCLNELPYIIKLPDTSSNFEISQSIDTPFPIITLNNEGCDSFFTITANVIELHGLIDQLTISSTESLLRFTVTAYSLPKPNIISATWIKDNDQIIIDENLDEDLLTILIKENGLYKCVLEAEVNGKICSFESSPILVDFVSNKNTQEAVVHLSPIPVKDNCKIESFYAISQIQLFTSDGRRILKLNEINQNELDLNLSSLQSGNYFIKIEGENYITYKRIIIAK